MSSTVVLLIESSRNGDESFSAALKRKYQVMVAHSGKQALAMAGETRPDVIVLDAVSLRTPGTRICARMRAALDDIPLIHMAADDLKKGDTPADVLLLQPFTSRKLVNRIERFVTAEESEALVVGPFSLNLTQQTLSSPLGEKKLTPKLSALMETFMRHPDQILDRKSIMQRVWKTDYVGDTRTLDVHIRWLRQTIEPTPRKPLYIKTVRGQGYRFSFCEVAPAAALLQKMNAEIK